MRACVRWQDADIDAILAHGEARTAELASKVQKVPRARGSAGGAGAADSCVSLSACVRVCVYVYVRPGYVAQPRQLPA